MTSVEAPRSLVERLKGHLRRVGALYGLVTAWLASWAGQFAAMQGEIADEGWHVFWASTLENHQSEFLQLSVQIAVMVLFANKFLKRSKSDVLAVQEQTAEMNRQLSELRNLVVSLRR